MTHGFKIKNNAGSEIILGNEEAYLYWGKKVVTVSSTSQITTHLFNLPQEIDVLILINVSDNSNDLTAYSSVSDGYHCMVTACRSSNPTFTATAYVFVLAKYVPLGAYGMALWNSDGILAFHTSRPNLRVQGICVWGQSTSTGYKTATVASASVGGLLPANGGIGGSAYTVLNQVGYSSGNRSATILDVWTGQQPTGLVGFSPSAAYINASYYDVYASLGDFT